MTSILDLRPTAVFERRALEHLDGLYNFALALTGDRAKAEETVTKTYLRANARFREAASEDDFKVWLFTLLRKVASKRRQRGRGGSPHELLATVPEKARLPVM